MCKHDFWQKYSFESIFYTFFFLFTTTLSFKYQASYLFCYLLFFYLLTLVCLFSAFLSATRHCSWSYSVILHESSWKIKKHWEAHFRKCDLALKLMIAIVLSKRIFCIIEPFDNLLQHDANLCSCFSRSKQIFTFVIKRNCSNQI